LKAISSIVKNVVRRSPESSILPMRSYYFRNACLIVLAPQQLWQLGDVGSGP
jgi:hypothetical protein